MEFLNLPMHYSFKDRRSGISLPKVLNENLAELVGIIVGDGHLNCRSINNWNSYSLTITCNLNEDKYYFDNTIQPIFKKLFNTYLSPSLCKKHNYFNAVACSKAIVLYINKLFDMAQ